MCCCCRRSSLFCVYYPFGILLFSHLCLSLSLFDRRPKHSASQPPMAPELETASRYVLLLSSFVFVLRVLFIWHSSVFSPLFVVIPLRQTSETQRVCTQSHPYAQPPHPQHLTSAYSQGSTLMPQLLNPKLLRTYCYSSSMLSSKCYSTRPKLLHSCRRFSTTKLLCTCRSPSSTTTMAKLSSSLSNWITSVLWRPCHGREPQSPACRFLVHTVDQT
jgi:hypothetical protein